jgi:hypothetical protein
MPFRGSTLDREYDKFKEVSGETAVRVSLAAGFAVPDNADNFQVAYPSSTQEVYTFYSGVTLLRTITINYVNASKEKIMDGSVT